MTNPSRAFSDNPQWLVLKKSVKKRDRYQCRICGETQGLNCAHILSRQQFPEEKYNENNVVLLCAACNWKYGEHLAKFARFREQMGISEVPKY